MSFLIEIFFIPANMASFDRESGLLTSREIKNEEYESLSDMN